MTQEPRRSGYASADETVRKRLSQRRAGGQLGKSCWGRGG